MGFFDRFKKDKPKEEVKTESKEIKTETNTKPAGNNKSAKDFAQEFKTYIEMGEIGLADGLIKPWMEAYPEDANFYYALIILGGRTNNSFDELAAISEKAESFKPMWDDGTDWYRNSAAMVILQKSGRI
ncbi:MAG: hypothetical protein IJL02_01780 [Methanobrevibacter sp.]|uniref:hypothetical protein n=1 Tax=Methanobrevibacter sp. TaxID=66852 RepID=UPI0025E48C22|nr:hypothetical protein [Methanobrevibacter sp.]MBQ6098577.1 hypothetical protein [Methanobrevibacter sp.]